MGDPRNVSRGARDRTQAAGASSASGTNGLTPGGEPAGRGRKQGRTLTIALVCLLTAALLATAFLLRRGAGPATTPTRWLLAACDVGQGDALFLALGTAGEAIAVDTGPDPAKEDKCASELGITRIPLLILTHFHADHIDGLPGLLNGRTVAQIETTTLDDPPAGAEQVRRIAATSGIPVTPVTPDEQRTFGPVSWRVLWPQAEHPLSEPTPPTSRRGNKMPMPGSPSAGGMSMRGGGASGGGMAEDGPAENSAPNNSSIVMAVTVQTGSSALHILLTGDIETPVQRILAADRAPYLPADILKVPHHGSANQDPAFLDAVHPSISVISVGAGNPYGHPSPRTVYLAGTGGARVFRTDLDGMVLIDAPDSPTAPIPVTATKGDGTIPLDGPTPSGLNSPAREGGRRSYRHRHHARTAPSSGRFSRLARVMSNL